MKTALFIIFPFLVAEAAQPAEVDRFCHSGDCDVLAVHQGEVKLTDSLRSLNLGDYVPAAQYLVPRQEAPIRSLVSTRRWRIVVSAYLDHSDESEAGLRVRFFGPEGKLRATDQVLMGLEQIRIGRLFGGDDDILAIQSNEEHSYNSRTDIWLLPEHGVPRRLIDANATFGKFSKDGGDRGGVWISRQTYDGVHAETKGWRDEFWAWDARSQSLVLHQ